MSIWLWILLGIVAFFVVSLLVGLAIAAILSRIGREFSRLMEVEPLESPLGHSPESPSETPQRHLASRRSSGARIR